MILFLTAKGRLGFHDWKVTGERETENSRERERMSNNGERFWLSSDGERDNSPEREWLSSDGERENASERGSDWAATVRGSTERAIVIWLRVKTEDWFLRFSGCVKVKICFPIRQFSPMMWKKISQSFRLNCESATAFFPPHFNTPLM